LIFGSSRVVGKYSTNDAPPSRNYAHNLPFGAPENENPLMHHLVGTMHITFLLEPQKMKIPVIFVRRKKSLSDSIVILV